MEEPVESAGSVLRQARTRQSLSLRAAAAGRCSPAHLSLVERDKRGISLDLLARLVPVLGLGPIELAQVLQDAGKRGRASR